MKTTLARLIERIQGTFYDRHTDLNRFVVKGYKEEDGKIYMILELEHNPEYDPKYLREFNLYSKDDEDSTGSEKSIEEGIHE
ncbi:MAG: hypothetical protein IJ717_01025 [Treponema sp.]|nr:hypothetical protein [Treponema sp.]